VSKSRFRVPHTLVLLFSMVLVAQLLTWILPQGEFQREVNEVGREEVVAGTYAPIEGGARVPWHKAFTAIPDGFAAAHDIIFFVFLVGGAFAVLRRTGAIDSLIAWLLERFEGRPNVLISGGVFLFAAGSATIGMAEEYMPFVPVLLILARGMGFDALTAVGILCIGYGAGYGAAAINPFTVLIAQDVAGLQPVSGLAYRLVLFVIFVAVGIHHVASYARRVAADPSRSLMADVESEVAVPEIPKTASFSAMHKLVLAIVIASIALLVWGIKEHHWYLNEMGALFLGLSLVMILVTRMGVDTGAREFCAGAAELTTTALLIGFARTIQVVLDDGQVVDTIINAVSQPLASLGPALASIGMLVFQSVCNLFIPSGSGQAYVTMPLMAPLADIVGIERQVAVLAYQFGDGLTNILVPTNAVLVGILAMAGVPFDRWLRFVMPFMVKMWILGSLALAVAVWIGYA
jgi:uncharacterized ion transporter superfamily protein YfcC